MDMQKQASRIEPATAPSRADAGPASVRIEDHGLIGDLNTAALVALDGSIDFLCLPDFDSDACFVSLLGNRENGYWKIAPAGPIRAIRRRYRPGTLVLETEFETETGAVRVVDFMPVRRTLSIAPRVVRIVRGLRGEVRMRSELVPRFACGYTVPLVSRHNGATRAAAGPDALYLRVSGERHPTFLKEFTMAAGFTVPFDLSWAPPYGSVPTPLDGEAALMETEDYWEAWTSKLTLPADYAALVARSLITLKACVFEPTGAIVAAPTFGLPETPGGERNWDYRFCWVRDASLTLRALLRAGAVDESDRFFKWLVDAVGGAPGQLQIMYGIRGERRLTEVELPWLSGYEGARPVRIGNAAYQQFQLDIAGEFAVILYEGAVHLGEMSPQVATALKKVAAAVARSWTRPDKGIWEMRGPDRDFTASKVSAWAAIDAWIKAIERFAPPEEDPTEWRALRKTIHDEVCAKGYDASRNTFTQYYGSKSLDGSLLLIPLSGFLPPADPRVVGTVEAIERELMPNGLVLRYRTDETADGLSGEEGTFLACSFWLVDAYHMMGRRADARRLFEKLIGLCNDLGLLAEEYLPKQHRQTGNFPQAFSHLALVQAAYLLSEGRTVKGSTVGAVGSLLQVSAAEDGRFAPRPS
jgi:GH15 family glucan-1,4-alpha-glucosidase